MKYKINDLFYSLQGEGSRAGSANIFLRFSDCNLACGFCDTEFTSGRMMSAREIVAEAKRLMPVARTRPAPRSIILTGGEPLLSYDQELATALREADFFICLETNGSVKPKAYYDFVACSPKCAEHVLAANFQYFDELRYVRRVGQSIPVPAVVAENLYISPEFSGDHLDRANLEHCVALVKANPEFRLSAQLHKFLKIA